MSNIPVPVSKNESLQTESWQYDIISYLVYWKCKCLFQSNLRNISSLSTWFCTFLSRYLCHLYIYSISMLGHI